MVTEEAMLTLLPHGTAEAGKVLKASVFVTPRLDTGGGDDELGRFDLFRSWADVVTQLIEGGGLALAFDGGPTLTAELDPDPPAHRPDPQLWSLLLPPTTLVRSRQLLDLSDRRWRSFPVADVLDEIRSVYADVASASPTSFPPRADVGEKLGPLSSLKHRERIDDMLDDRFERVGENGASVYVGGGGGTQAKLAAFAQARRFYERPGTRIGRDDAVPARPAARRLDFHDACTALADHPELLRRLGLVLDVRVPADVPATGRVRVADVDGLPPAAAEGTRPWTRYVRRNGSFRAEERKDGDHEDGMLHLDRERHVITDLDVDGSGLKIVDFAATVSELLAQASQMDADGESLPALRNAGITVARRDRAVDLVAHVVAVHDREDATRQGNPAELWADDLVRGYRVDVRDDRTGDWWSLCRRVGTYHVARDGGVDLRVEPDEGYVKASSATATPEGLPGSDDDLYLHEAIFGWDGWSLVAPRPGERFATHRTEDLSMDSENPCALTATFAPEPRSLPPLRFGRQYELRARAVDLSGHSWHHHDGDTPEHTASPPHTYRRWEPVPAPALLPRRPFGEGESMRRLVIRSTTGETASSYVALSRVRDLAGHERSSGADGLDRSYVDTDQRHVLPPKTALQQVELHGGLDRALGDRTQQVRDAVLELARREAGTILDLPGATVVNVGEEPTRLPLANRGDALKVGEQVVVDTDSVPLPYLADVLARGAALSGAPGAGVLPVEVPFGRFPDQLPFRLVLRDGPLGHEWKQRGRTLTITLPPSEVVTLGLSCHLGTNDDGTDDLDLLAIWHLLPPSRRQQLHALARAGQHWMLTPKVELTLVHAVEKPIDPPVLQLTTALLHRLPGETFASLTGTVDVHAKSTGRVDVRARWTEPVDDVLRPRWVVLDGEGHVTDFDVDPDEDPVQLGRDAQPGVRRARHELGDTKHRLVTYDALATTRFREYFPPEITNDPALITLAGPQVQVHVRSSRRPEPPQIVSVIPTFRWVDGAFKAVRGARPTAGVRRTRAGAGVRVYLDRPWFSSGADEHLAVVLADQVPPIAIGDALDHLGIDESVLGAAVRRMGVRGVTANKLRSALEAAIADAGGISAPPALELDSLLVDSGIVNAVLTGDTSEHVTRWGSDPIWAGGVQLPSGPRIQSFTNADRWDTGVSLAEVPFGRVAVAAFEPSHDEDRRLWFADIDVDAGDAYFPFVKLSLARYQPYSIGGAHLSRVVVPEWAQLAPDRTATVRVEREMLAVSLRGVAAVNRVGRRTGGGLDDSRLVVGQVERIRGAGDVGWAPVGEPVVLGVAGVDDAGVATWRARLPLPDASRGWRHRVAIEEHELHETDASQATHWEMALTTAGTIDLGLLGGEIAIPGVDVIPMRTRLVYADHFPLEASPRGGALRPVLREEG